MISAARNSPNERDEVWHIDTVPNYDLPAESLPLILGIQEKIRKEVGKPLTIREAWWASKLQML